jgi:hypothetical protein
MNKSHSNNKSSRSSKNRQHNNKPNRGFTTEIGPVPGSLTRKPTIKGPITKRYNELKFNDLAAAGYNLDSTGTLTALNLIAEGTDYTNRIGRMCNMRSVAICGHAQANSTATINKCRVLLVWDNAVLSALPAVTDVLAASTSSTFYNVNNQNRFTILWDKTFVVGSIVATTTWTAAVNIDVEVPLTSLTQFNGTAAAITSVQNGAIYMVTVGNNAAGTSAATLYAATRVRYLDSQ